MKFHPPALRLALRQQIELQPQPKKKNREPIQVIRAEGQVGHEGEARGANCATLRQDGSFFPLSDRATAGTV
jgi:hypothetical protein